MLATLIVDSERRTRVFGASDELEDPRSSLGHAVIGTGGHTMCLGVPGQIVGWVDEPHGIATAQVSDVRRSVNVGLIDDPELGDWVLIHVGFAMSKIDEEEAHSTREFLVALGKPYEDELEELRASAIE